MADMSTDAEVGPTPGPWTANLHHTQVSAGRTYGFIHAHTAVPLAAVTLGVEGLPHAEGRANANLIAASPGLLKALQREVRNCPMCRGDSVTDQTFDHVMGSATGKIDCPRCKDSRAAIAKALGQAGAGR